MTTCKIKALLGDTLVTEATHLIEDLKLVKSPAELGYIRRAAAIADVAMQTAVETIAEGKTELEVAADMHRTLMALGGDAGASPMNFATGERRCYSHGMPSERKIRRGDYMHFEYGAAHKRYCATLGRQLCLGQPTPGMQQRPRSSRDVPRGESVNA